MRVAARRQQARAQRERVLTARQLAPGGRPALGVGETMRERAERKRAENPVHLVQVGGGDMGSVPVYGRA